MFGNESREPDANLRAIARSLTFTFYLFPFTLPRIRFAVLIYFFQRKLSASPRFVLQVPTAVPLAQVPPMPGISPL